jgi:hypothetical protein
MSTSASHTPDEVRQQGREDWLVLLLIVGTIAAMVALGVGSVKFFDSHPTWLMRDVAVTQELNEKYVERIEVVRDREGDMRVGSLVETITIDGYTRADCTVPDDDQPTIECTNGVTLTPESESTDGGQGASR